MELRDYLAALRRYWLTWVGLAVLCVLTAMLAAQLLPRTYEATAQVFVASSGESTTGSQFVNQRVKSYPDIAVSLAVLRPVIAELDLPDSIEALRSRVRATNPVDTSQIAIVVTSGSAMDAAAVANAVADQFGSVVEDLETPRSGDSPVALTVTDPATVPSAPVFPDRTLLLGLGLVAGLSLGAATAVVRSRIDTRVHTPDDVHQAWGEDPEPLTVYAPPAGGGRRSLLAGRPAGVLARRLEALAETGPLRVAVVAPSSHPRSSPSAFVDEVARELRARGMTTTVDGATARPAAFARPPATGPAAASGAGIHLHVTSPRAPLREWRRIAAEYDGVVLVVESGHVDRSDIGAIRSILAAADLRPLAAVLTHTRRRADRRPRADAVAPSPAQVRPLPPRPDAVGARPAR